MTLTAEPLADEAAAPSTAGRRVVLHAAAQSGVGHPHVRVLAAAGFLVIPLRSSRALLDLLVGMSPELVLLDTDLPGQDTASLVGRLGQLGDPRTVVVGHLPTSERTRLLQEGADACLRLPLDAEELIALTEALLRRRSVPAPPPVHQVLRVGVFSLDLARRTVQVDGRAMALTGLETDLLAYFLRHPGLALPRERLLADVWGYTVGGTDTVTVHVRRLRSKVESAPSSPRWIRTVWGVGYCFSP